MVSRPNAPSHISNSRHVLLISCQHKTMDMIRLESANGTVERATMPPSAECLLRDVTPFYEPPASVLSVYNSFTTLSALAS